MWKCRHVNGGNWVEIKEAGKNLGTLEPSPMVPDFSLDELEKAQKMIAKM